MSYWIILILFFSQKFFPGDYLFVYYYDDNNFVALIYANQDSADTPEAEIPDEDLVDTVGYDMLEAM